MPAAKSRSPHFKRTAQFSLDYAPVTITQYESTRTGMRMAVVDQKGPKVNGYFALATEILDDSGAPHTLEHLVFMGSKSYKYKGFLDKLATRAYSTTNAWTATEHTAYTLDTAGWDGFAQVLPVYLEHVIVPTLTDSACYTEVHHVDGTGHDAGVVYSEMQGVQNCQEELMLLQAKRLMYPEGVGFRYETGGMMDQLRVLTADRIRAFHKEMYQPKNLCLVITGEVNHEELLQIVDDFEGTILNDVPAIDAPFKRPWTTSEPTPPFRKTIVETVHFPEEDESMGEVLVAYLGPKCNEHLQVAALSVLMSYLCGSSISLLDNVLVEKEHFCSNVYFTLDVRSDMAIWFTLSAVETDRLGEAEARLTQLLNEAATNPLDMEYMNDCIKRYRRQIKLRCENAGSFFGEAIIEDHLYGHRDGRDLRVCENLDELDVLEGWSDEQWREFLSRWFVDAHHISILGKPSEALSKKITADEKLRVKHQQEQLGEEGMKDLANRLSLAQQENDTPIPDELLSRFAVPDAESVHFIPTTTARAGRARAMGRLDNDIQSIVDADSVDVPLFLHFEHIPSNFVRFKINMCTGPVPLALKPLIPLYLMNFFTTPALIDGQRVEFEQLILDLEKVTEAYDIDAEYANPELIALSLIAEPSNYQSVIKWIKTLLFDAIHDPARLHASLTKVLADVPDEKRDGRQMASSVSIMTSYLPESSSRARNTLSKATYLKQVKKQLKANPQSVVSQFSALCKALHRPENFRIYVGADVHKLDRPTSAWTVLSEGFDSNAPLEPLDSRRALLSPAGANPGSASFIVPMGTIDSSYAKVTGKGVDSYSHPDYAALTVARAYMNAVEGPLWVAVRGTGLAYGTSFYRAVDIGALQLTVERSPDAYKAIAAAKKQVTGHADGSIPISQLALEGAVSEIVLAMADEQPTMATAADAGYTNLVIRGISKNFSRETLGKVQAVTADQVRDVLGKYFVPIFEPGKSNLVITCATIMKEGIVKSFEEQGWKIEVSTLESFQESHAASEGDEHMVDADDDEDEDEEEEDDDSEDHEDEEEGDDNDEDMKLS